MDQIQKEIIACNVEQIIVLLVLMISAKLVNLDFSRNLLNVIHVYQIV